GEDITSGRGETPDREPGRVDPRERRRAFDRCLPVAELLPDTHDLARLPPALSQMAIVECQDGEPGIVEPACEQVGAGLLGHREPPGHDHAGAVGSPILPAAPPTAPPSHPNLL